MKKVKMMFVLLFLMFTLLGCGTVNNEIYNKSYNVGEIDISDFENLVTAVIEKTEGSVLGVSNYSNSLFDDSVSYGSGFVYKTIAIMKDGTEKSYDEVLDSDQVKTFKYYLVTNRHVVEGDSQTLKVYFGNEDLEVDAELVAYDDYVDLAVITFEHTTIIKPLELANSDNLKKGNFAIAIGSPSGYEFYGSATFGIISHPKRYIEEDLNSDGVSDWDSEYIQHDVAINPGNSGGPLINLEGKVIGINTMKFVSDEIDNMGFSIPSNLVASIIPILEQGKKPERTKLGIEIIGIKQMTSEQKKQYNISEDIDYGTFINSITNSGFGYKNGLRAKDIIVEFNGVKIYKPQEVRIELNKFILDENMSCEVIVLRDGKLVTLTFNF